MLLKPNVVIGLHDADFIQSIPVKWHQTFGPFWHRLIDTEVKMSVWHFNTSPSVTSAPAAKKDIETEYVGFCYSVYSS